MGLMSSREPLLVKKSNAEYSHDIDFVPANLDWPAADHPPEDSFYVWGPAVPESFIVNYETR